MSNQPKTRTTDEHYKAARILDDKISNHGTYMLDVLQSIIVQANGDLSDERFRIYVKDVLIPAWVEDLIRQRNELRA